MRREALKVIVEREALMHTGAGVANEQPFCGDFPFFGEKAGIVS